MATRAPTANSQCVKHSYCDSTSKLCVADKLPGDACTQTRECAGNGDLLGVAQYCVSGTCGVGLQLGDDCSGTNAQACDFAKGLLCEGTTQVCTTIPIATVGQACGLVGGAVTLCDGESRCSASPTGTCQARKALNAACTLAGNGDPDDVTKHDCLPHLSCINSVCVATPDFTCLESTCWLSHIVYADRRCATRNSVARLATTPRVPLGFSACRSLRAFELGGAGDTLALVSGELGNDAAALLQRRSAIAAHVADREERRPQSVVVDGLVVAHLLQNIEVLGALLGGTVHCSAHDTLRPTLVI